LIARIAVTVAAVAAFAAPATAALADAGPSACVSGGFGVSTGQGQVGPVTPPPPKLTVPVDQCAP